MMTRDEVMDALPGLTVERLELWVGETWVRPAQGQEGHRFDAADLARLRLIVELCDDMALEEAVPVILRLIDRLDGAARQLRAVADAIAAQPPSVRAAIAAHLATARPSE